MLYRAKVISKKELKKAMKLLSTKQLLPKSREMLEADFTTEAWAKEGFDKILIDPPRSGALDVCNHLTSFGAKRIVYVSCNPATLARDAGVIVEKGYRLVKAGVMDMFPHTAHVESIALFEKI